MEMGSSSLLARRWRSMESVTEEIMREILLKLPTMDVGRCRCVSRQWRDLLRDESLIALHVHAAHVVSGPGAEALVVTESREDGIGLEMVVRNASSGKLMCEITDLSLGYRPASACNGLLLITANTSNWPVFVCNPITGEKAKIPAPPAGTRHYDGGYFFTYAMGFSPSTGQYKLFRFSSSEPHVGWVGTLQGYMDVYTLGDKVGSWRQHPHRFPNRAVYYYDHSPPPALVDGKLYVLKTDRRMLVIDVATEAHDTYRLPEESTRRYDADADVHPFEMCGRLCIAARSFVGRHHLLHFWVMHLPLPLPHDEGKMPLHGSTSWELRYTFCMNDVLTANYSHHRLSSTWFSSCEGMLCYRLGDCIYKYDTTKDDDRKKRKKKKKKKQGADHSYSEWDHQIQLPVASSRCQQWKVYGGYRPSLLSPHHLAFRRNDDKQQQFEHAFGHALGCKQSSKER